MLSILHVEDNPGDARMVKETLDEHLCSSKLTQVGSLKEAFSILGKSDGFDVVLLDLNLPDSIGVDTVRTFRKNSMIPIVVLTGNDGQMGLEAVRAGAQEFLEKDCVGRCVPKGLLVRFIQFAVERHVAAELLKKSARQMTDSCDLLQKLITDVSTVLDTEET